MICRKTNFVTSILLAAMLLTGQTAWTCPVSHSSGNPGNQTLTAATLAACPIVVLATVRGRDVTENVQTKYKCNVHCVMKSSGYDVRGRIHMVWVGDTDCGVTSMREGDSYIVCLNPPTSSLCQVYDVYDTGRTVFEKSDQNMELLSTSCELDDEFSAAGGQSTCAPELDCPRRVATPGECSGHAAASQSSAGESLGVYSIWVLCCLTFGGVVTFALL